MLNLVERKVIATLLKVNKYNIPHVKKKVLNFNANMFM